MAGAEASAAALQTKLQEIDRLTNAAPAEVAAEGEAAPRATALLSDAGQIVPTDEDVNDMVGQLKVKAAELDPVTGPHRPDLAREGPELSDLGQDRPAGQQRRLGRGSRDEADAV